MARTGKKDQRPSWMRSVKLVRFIAALKEEGNVSEALRKAKCSRGWVYEKRQTDRDFADAFAEAKACGIEALIDEAHRRAYKGWLEPKFHQGEECGYVRKFSDPLLMFLIKQADPSYREAYKVEHGSSSSTPFLFQMQLHPDAMAELQAKEGAV